MSYDDAGNILKDQKFRQLKFQYDANNRQKQSSNLDDTGVVMSVYDADGQRVATQVGGALTNVCVYDAMGKLLAEYGAPSAGPGGTSYVMSDHQGSPRVVTNTSGAVISRHDYLPFGEELGTVGMRTSGQGYGAADAARQKYAGMESEDGSGMATTLWRKYDSSSGRWTSPDPYAASMTIANPQSFNRYSYVGNDPVNMRDPSGLMTKEGQPDPDTANPKDEPPGDPFETGRSITTEAEARYDRRVSDTIEANKDKDRDGEGSKGEAPDPGDGADGTGDGSGDEPQDTVPDDLKVRVQDITGNCSGFLDDFLNVLSKKSGPVFSHDFVELLNAERGQACDLRFYYRRLRNQPNANIHSSLVKVVVVEMANRRPDPAGVMMTLRADLRA